MYLVNYVLLQSCIFVKQLVGVTIFVKLRMQSSILGMDQRGIIGAL